MSEAASPHDWNPGSKYQTLIDRANEILTNEPRSVRDVYYAFVSRSYEYDYRQVKRALKKGRRAGYIDPRLIIDPSRTAAVRPNQGYDSPEEFADSLDGIARRYTENFWTEQPTYVEVWLEKQALVSVFEPICREYNVRLEPTRGDWSDGKMYQAAQRLIPHIQAGKDVKILVFGDFNPSGFHAPVAVQRTLGAYGLPIDRSDLDDEEFDDMGGNPWYFDVSPPWSPFEFEDDDGELGGTLDFERVALNLEHIEEFDLPQNPTPSSSDKDRTLRDRFMKYVSAGRDVNVELNALKEFERAWFEELIEESITKHIDDAAKQRVEDRIEERRDQLADAVTVDKSVLDDSEGEP